MTPCRSDNRDNKDMRYIHCNRRAGFAPLLIVLIVVVIIGAVGAVTWFAVKKFSTAGKPSASGVVTEATTDDQKLGEIAAAAPSLDFDLGAMPSLDLSVLNVGGLDINARNPFPSFSVNSDFSADYDLDIAIPTVELDVPTASAAPAETPSEEGSGASSGGTTPDAASCAQFSAMPSVSYCSMVGDANGKALCEACKAAGF